MKRLLALPLPLLSLCLLLTVAGCQPGDTAPTPIGEVTRPDLVELIDWERSPSTVIFRAEVVGGPLDEEFVARSDIPACTVYGDNRVVWTTTASRVDDGVAYDFVSDEAIRLFVESLTLDYGLYNYQAGAALVPEDSGSPVVEQITLFVNGQVHIADSLSGWPFDLYQRIVGECRALSQSPIEFVPDGAWVSAQQVEYNPNAPSIAWNASATGLDLAQLAQGEPRWLTGQTVRAVWDALREGGNAVRFEQNDATYNVALEIPNITRLSPPRP